MTKINRMSNNKWGLDCSNFVELLCLQLVISKFNYGYSERN